jgi:hypothetical protein
MAQELGLDAREVCKPIRYRTLVRDAAATLDLSPDTVELMWRLLSGVAHGRRVEGPCPESSRAGR